MEVAKEEVIEEPVTVDAIRKNQRSVNSLRMRMQKAKDEAVLASLKEQIDEINGIITKQLQELKI